MGINNKGYTVVFNLKNINELNVLYEYLNNKHSATTREVILNKTKTTKREYETISTKLWGIVQKVHSKI